jgi:membrane AbrB-like protein
MTLLGGMCGGDVRRLAIVHIARVVLIVVAVPLFLQIQLGEPVGRISVFASGAVPISLADAATLTFCVLAAQALGKLLRFPSGSLIFALILSAALHISGVLEVTIPAWMTALMQVVVGLVAGAKFAGMRLNEVRSTLTLAVIWATAMLSFAGITALVTTSLSGRSFQTMLVALAPGGVVEMTAVTFAIGVDVAFVVFCQLCRIVLVLTLMPLAFRVLVQGASATRAD